jgi:hypothetical protein
MVPSCEHAIVAIIGYTTTARSVVFHNVFHQKNLTQFITQNQIDTRSVQITPARAYAEATDGRDGRAISSDGVLIVTLTLLD